MRTTCVLCGKLLITDIECQQHICMYVNRVVVCNQVSAIIFVYGAHYDTIANT